MFVDEIEFSVRGGKGGDGAMSFRREKYIEFGGPDGGDGGDGGSVVLEATTHENTLFHLAGRAEFSARGGTPGSPRNCAGSKADDLVIPVPVGTVVLDAERGHILKDLAAAGERFAVVRGGRGGKGNARFSSSTNRAPRQYEQGIEGELRRIRLSLKLIADVGLVGLPNAGKSTLLATLSRARPRIADYPFTTLEPHLGIVPIPDGGSFVMADIPGLIEGAHDGKGLGDKFLKHVERTRVLLHLVDCSSTAEADPVESWRVIRGELASYSQALGERPCLLVATKVEDDEGWARARELTDAAGVEVLAISAATGQGMDSLLGAILPMVRAAVPDGDLD